MNQLKNPAAEKDARLIADIWRSRGPDAAALALWMTSWLGDLVKWEQIVLADRARHLFRSSTTTEQTS